MTERLIELEIRYAQLERLVEELSTQLFEQRRELDALRGLVGQLGNRVTSLAPPDEPPTDDPPPHW